MPTQKLSNVPDYQAFLEYRFMGYLLEQGASEKTRKNYRTDLRHFLSWLLTHFPTFIDTNPGSTDWMAHITADHLERYKAAAVSDSTPITTINRRLSALRLFFTAAVSQMWIPHTPMATVQNISKATDGYATRIDADMYEEASSSHRASDKSATILPASLSSAYAPTHAPTTTPLRSMIVGGILILSVTGSGLLAWHAHTIKTAQLAPITLASLGSRFTAPSAQNTAVLGISEASDTESSSGIPSPTPSDAPVGTPTEDTSGHALLDETKPTPGTFTLPQTASADPTDATASALLTYGATLGGPHGEFVTIDKDITLTKTFAVLAETLLGQTTVGGSLFVDGKLRLSTDGIQTIGEPLYLQKLALGGLDFVAGALTIDPSGFVTVNRTIAIMGNAHVQGILGASTIAPLGNSLTLDLGHPYATGSATPSGFGTFFVRGTGNGNVAAITASGSAAFAGDLYASGSGIFSKLAIINPPATTPLTTNDTVGTSILPADISNVYIPTTQVSAYSRIYITPISSTNNQVLFVREMLPGDGFTVGIDVPTDDDIQFNWWIIN